MDDDRAVETRLPCTSGAPTTSTGSRSAVASAIVGDRRLDRRRAACPGGAGRRWRSRTATARGRARPRRPRRGRPGPGRARSRRCAPGRRGRRAPCRRRPGRTPGRTRSRSPWLEPMARGCQAGVARPAVRAVDEPQPDAADRLDGQTGCRGTRAACGAAASPSTAGRAVPEVVVAPHGAVQRLEGQGVPDLAEQAQQEVVLRGREGDRPLRQRAARSVRVDARRRPLLCRGAGASGRRRAAAPGARDRVRRVGHEQHRRLVVDQDAARRAGSTFDGEIEPSPTPGRRLRAPSRDRHRALDNGRGERPHGGSGSEDSPALSPSGNYLPRAAVRDLRA